MFFHFTVERGTEKKQIARMIAIAYLLSFVLSCVMAAILLAVGNWAWELPPCLSFGFKHILGIGVILFVLGLMGSGSK